VALTSIAALLAFVLDSSIVLWGNGQRRRAAVVGGGLVLFLVVGRVYGLLVESGVAKTPYFFGFTYLGVLLAMGRELGNEVMRASKLAEQLRESECRMELAARAAALGFWTWDVARDEIWATHSARSLFGFGPSERINLMRFLDAQHRDDRDAVKQAIEKALKGGFEYEARCRVPVSGGEARWVAARGRVELDAAGQPALMRGVVLDIAAQLYAELELQGVRGQLAHAGRVSMMGQFASALAHELSQPLRAILRNSEAAELFLQSAEPDLDELRAIVGDIRKDDQRAAEVIDHLRSLLKRGDLEVRPLNLNELLEGVVALTRADAAVRGVTLQVAAAPDLPRVMGDRVHLQQALLNLLLNAMDAMNGQQDGKRQITLRASRNGASGVEVSVSDAGHGLAPETLAQLFEPFFTPTVRQRAARGYH
jgi:two-component system, LuxR family, sensor kinase FixL